MRGKWTWYGRLIVGLCEFGGAWLVGTAVGWGIRYDPLMTFIGVGLIPLLLAATAFMGMIQFGYWFSEPMEAK